VLEWHKSGIRYYDLGLISMGARSIRCQIAVTQLRCLVVLFRMTGCFFGIIAILCKNLSQIFKFSAKLMVINLEHFGFWRRLFGEPHRGDEDGFKG
jgi:hypothetical protein